MQTKHLIPASKMDVGKESEEWMFSVSLCLFCAFQEYKESGTYLAIPKIHLPCSIFLPRYPTSVSILSSEITLLTDHHCKQ